MKPTKHTITLVSLPDGTHVAVQNPDEAKLMLHILGLDPNEHVKRIPFYPAEISDINEPTKQLFADTALKLGEVLQRHADLVDAAFFRIEPTTTHLILMVEEHTDAAYELASEIEEAVLNNLINVHVRAHQGRDPQLLAPAGAMAIDMERIKKWRKR